MRGGATRKVGLGTLGWSLAAVVTRLQLARLFTETPRYEVELGQRRFEVRRYASRVQAETVLNAASWGGSLNDGFGRLAAYISGKNARREKIAMTAPVTVTVGAVDRATRTVTFKMPDRESVESLPAPNDKTITLRWVPPRRIATLVFSGRYGADWPEHEKWQLMHHVRAAHLLPIGDVTFAAYDAPWVLPWLRRNEVWVEVSSAPAMNPA